MEYKKSMIIIILAIFLASVASVCAGDVNDAVMASEDTALIEVPQTDDISVNDAGQAIGQSNDEEIISEGNVGTFSELQNNITAKYGGTLELDRNYEYDEGFDSNGIKIEQNITIDGKGHTIDAKGKSGVFDVQASDVTIKNLTIKNAHSNQGGAICFSQFGIVINCNFTDNSGTWGGAVYFTGGGEVTNCNFTNNHASHEGGAVWMNYGNVINSKFIGNSGTWGGAVWMNYGNVINSKFIGNSAPGAGVILSNRWCGIIADTCIFKTDSDTTYNVDVRPPTLNVDNFTTAYGSGEKLTFDLKTNSNMTVNNGNISISVYYKNNDSWVGNYSCLSGEGWTVDLPVGYYYAVFNTEYAQFKPINRTITVKIKTQLTASAVSTTYDVKKNLVITLKDGYGNPLSGVEVTVKIKKAKTYTTDKNGKIKINVAKLVPKKYTAKISFAGNANYSASSANAKVTVKKVKAKITAKKKTFKVKKPKKYTITLKTNKKKALKKGKVTLTVKVKGKKKIKITKKTSKKGKATFNLKKLTKKGTFKATVTFKGNKYYKKVTKKVKITIK